MALTCEHATKFTYDVQRERWSQEAIVGQLHQRKLGEGGMRVAYRFDEVCPDGSVVPCVAKFFKPEVLCMQGAPTHVMLRGTINLRYTNVCREPERRQPAKSTFV